MVPEGDNPLYDLYCDHGFLGEYFLRAGRKVFFNDQKDFLLDHLKSRLLLSDDEILYGRAQELKFSPNSTVLMLGVGGHLMKECFESWINEKDSVFKGQKFIISPHYHLIELGHYLSEVGARCLQQSFVWDGGYGYEFFLISFDKSLGRAFETFDTQFWQRQLQEGSEVEKYLNMRLKFTDSHQDAPDFFRDYREKLHKFLNSQ